MTLDLNKDSFRKAYEENKILIVDFWADWCGPCKSFAPVFERVSHRHPDIVFGKVDTEAEQEIAAHFGIRSIPTLMVIREGIELYFEPGAITEMQLEELIQQAKTVDMEAVRRRVAEEDAAAEAAPSSENQ